MKIVPAANGFEFDVVMAECEKSQDSQTWLWDKYERPDSAQPVPGIANQ
jgi:hypothetical protein